MRDGKEDCRSHIALDDCNKGFSAGTNLTSSFGNDCTPLEPNQTTIQFQLRTQNSGWTSGWCTDKVKIEASNGNESRTFYSFDEEHHSVEEGDEHRLYSASYRPES